MIVLENSQLQIIIGILFISTGLLGMSIISRLKKLEEAEFNREYCRKLIK